MTLFEKNTRALLQTDARHQPLIDRLTQTAPATEVEFFETRDGQFSLKYQGVLLHDLQSPVEEAGAVLNTACQPGAQRVHVIVGLGLGYLLDLTYQASPGKIIVYEPDLPFLRFILENIDLSDYLTSGRVWLADDELDFMDIYAGLTITDDQLDVLVLKGHAHLLGDAIASLMNKLVTFAEDRLRNIKTLQHFKAQWLKQFFDNYACLQQIDTLDAVRDRFPGKPALVISRGPSLDHSLEAIKALADSVVLIAVGGALRRLHETGITPDFAVFLDANGMAEQLHGLPPEYLAQITFMMSPLTQPCCYNTPSRGKMVFLGENQTAFADWLDQVLDKKHMRLEGGGTVSLIAFQSALAMGCSPVILVGQDLAFPGNQVYAGGVELKTDENGCMALDRTESLYAQPEAMTRVKGQDGRMLPALKAYEGFIRYFEDMAVRMNREGKSVQLYNASIGGALIEGYACKPLSEFVDTFTPWKSPYALGQPPVPSPNAIETRRQQLTQGLADLQASLSQASRLWEQINRDLLSLSPAANQAQEKLNKLHQRYQNFIEANPFISYLVLLEISKYREKCQAIANQPNALQTDTFQAFAKAFGELLANGTRILKDEVMPCVKTAQQQLAKPPEMAEYAPILGLRGH